MIGMRTYRKVVCESGSWWHSALRYTSRTIHVRSSVLEHTMEMEGCAHIPEAVVQIHNELVAFGYSNGRDGPLVIQANNRSLELAIWIGSNPSGIKVVCNCSSIDYREKTAYCKEEVGQRESHF